MPKLPRKGFPSLLAFTVSLALRSYKTKWHTKGKNCRAVPSFSIRLALLWRRINRLLAGLESRRHLPSLVQVDAVTPAVTRWWYVYKNRCKCKNGYFSKNNILYLNVFQYISGRRADSQERKVAPLLNCLLPLPPLPPPTSHLHGYKTDAWNASWNQFEADGPSLRFSCRAIFGVIISLRMNPSALPILKDTLHLEWFKKTR